MLFCILDGERKYIIYINVSEFFPKKRNATSFVRQTKKESETSIKGQME